MRSNVTIRRDQLALSTSIGLPTSMLVNNSSQGNGVRKLSISYLQKWTYEVLDPDMVVVD